MLALPLRGSTPELYHGKYVAGMFGSGEQGVWYDPSDLSTMYQDAEGTTPVTGVEQPVGLILDKIRGLGPELVTNGTFDTNINGWTSNQGQTPVWSAGRLRLSTQGSTGTSVLQAISCVVGRSYALTVSYMTVSGYGVGPGLRISTSGVDYGASGQIYRTPSESPTAFVNRTVVFTATQATIYVYLIASGGHSATTTYEFDNISVRELPGNHATQATTASRPRLSARVNLLTKTEQFNDAAWLKTNATIAANAVVAPDGTTTADTFIPGAGTVFGLAVGAYYNSSYFSQGVSVAAATYKYRLRVKSAGYDMAQLRVAEGPTLTGTNQAATRVLLSNGAVNLQFGTGNLTDVTSACTRTDDGWCDITLTFTSGAARTLYFGIWAWNTTAITSDGVNGLHIWGADLRVANESASLPAYQRVNTSTDYDTVGFPYYLSFDGVDDWLVTPSIDFTATDKMTVLAGVRKLSDAASGVVIELSADAALNRAFGFFAPSTFGGMFSYRVRSTGSLPADLTISGYPAPISNVVVLQSNIATDLLSFRVNGTQAASTSTDQGTGNYGNFPLYIGRRGGTTNPFAGNLYGLIVRGAATDDDHLTNAEKFLAYKSGVTL